MGCQDVLQRKTGVIVGDDVLKVCPNVKLHHKRLNSIEYEILTVL